MSPVWGDIAHVVAQLARTKRRAFEEGLDYDLSPIGLESRSPLSAPSTVSDFTAHTSHALRDRVHNT